MEPGLHQLQPRLVAGELSLQLVLLLPAGVAGRSAILVSPFPRTATGLTEAQADAVAAMRRKLAAVPMPRSLAFIDATTGRASIVYRVEPPWLARQLHDRHAVPLAPFGLRA